MSWEDPARRLEGRIVVLEPLAPAHEEGLRAAAADPEIWRWMLSDGSTVDGFADWFERALANARGGIEVPFTVLDRASGEPIGSTRFLTLRPHHRGLEIGYTWLAARAWGGGANVEGKLLLLGHAFERLGCIRVEFKTDALNERSRAALEALPARFEGIFRNHMLAQESRRRDSAYYAIVDEDWPEVKANLVRRLNAKS
ncbi:MAG: GNAT family N-acetyltransferase [Gaiellaceae bacterium]